MKKKFLSLMMAAAVVASTSVSAFAEELKTYDINSTTEQNHKVTITGDVANRDNVTLPGTITVTVPTTMAFTVDNKGNVDGGRISVVNKSNQSVEVVAKEFSDNTPESKIVLVKESDLDRKIESNDGNKYVSLNLVGDNNTVGLISQKTAGKTGFIKQDGTEIGDNEKTTLGNAVSGSDLELRLEGRAKHSDSSQHAYEAPETAMNDTFSLMLKIQKTR